VRLAIEDTFDEGLPRAFTPLLGVLVTVKGVDLTERDEIVAICSRGRLRQSIPILDLVLPSPAPAGAEWSEAYRCCRTWSPLASERRSGLSQCQE